MNVVEGFSGQRKGGVRTKDARFLQESAALLGGAVMGCSVCALYSTARFICPFQVNFLVAGRWLSRCVTKVRSCAGSATHTVAVLKAAS